MLSGMASFLSKGSSIQDRFALDVRQLRRRYEAFVEAKALCSALLVSRECRDGRCRKFWHAPVHNRNGNSPARPRGEEKALPRRGEGLQTVWMKPVGFDRAAGEDAGSGNGGEPARNLLNGVFEPRSGSEASRHALAQLGRVLREEVLCSRRVPDRLSKLFGDDLQIGQRLMRKRELDVRIPEPV